MSTFRDGILRSKYSSKPLKLMVVPLLSIVIVQLSQRFDKKKKKTKRAHYQEKKIHFVNSLTVLMKFQEIPPTEQRRSQKHATSACCSCCFRGGAWLCENVMSRLQTWEKKNKKKQSVVGEHNDLCGAVLMFSFRFLLTGSAGVGRTWAYFCFSLPVEYKYG